MTYEQISKKYPPVASSFVYFCVKCGKDTWKEGISLAKDDAGTHTMCDQCYSEEEGK